jgi:CheY-like chemotaxis protein
MQKTEASHLHVLTADTLSLHSRWLLTEQNMSEPDARAVPAEGIEQSSTRKIVALLAEDNRADALIVEEAIDVYDLPIDLHVVEDGEKAFQFIERAEHDPHFPCPELLLLDLNLPRRSGREVLERVRNSPACKHIPVLVITSSNSAKDRKDISRLGANGYFQKPASYDEFLKVGEALKRLLDQYRDKSSR